MVSTTLVDTQIEDGEKILRQLDADRFNVDSALWFFESEKEKWIFLIATPLVKSIGPKNAYAKIKKSLDNVKPKSTTLEVALIKPDHDLLRVLKSAFKVVPKFAHMRLTNNVINGTLIEDALIYRLSS